MRAVLDTNILVSGLLWRGPPRDLLDVFVPRRKLTICTSPPLIAEVHRVLNYPKLAFRANLLAVDVRNSLATIVERAEIYTDLQPLSVIKEDPADNTVLATAVAAEADAIVSGDRHLRQLQSFQEIPILTATETIKRLRRRTTKT